MSDDDTLYAALQDQWRLVLAAKDAEIERLRSVVRTAATFGMLDHLGFIHSDEEWTTFATTAEAAAVRRALGDEPT